MAPTIDHLRVDHVIHVTQDFVDADGTPHQVGEQGLITNMQLDWGTGEIRITWDRAGRIEMMRFVRESTTGPGNGRMKQFFEMGEYVPAPIPGKKLIPGIGYVPIVPEIPDISDDLITSSDQFGDAITRVWALAARRRFGDANEQLTAAVTAPDRRGPLEQSAAERICHYAKLHAFDDDLTVHRWLRDQGIGLWYGYGAQATSGGEGTERARHIRAAEREFQELDRKLNRSLDDLPAVPSVNAHDLATTAAPANVSDNDMLPLNTTATVASLAAATMLISGLPRLKERKLADIAVIGVPAAMDDPSKSMTPHAQKGRVSWTFSDTYFWASFGGITRYKQQLIVGVMAPDATPNEYDEFPYQLDPSYDTRKELRRVAMGSAQLTVYDCVYEFGNERAQAYQYIYVDRSRRLQFAWHTVAKEVDLNTGLAQIPRIASSFRLLRDPVTTFAEMRDAPRKEAAARASRLSTVHAMLRREGLPTLVPGKPVMHQGAYVEWMADPEPRYQLLVPLGRIRAAANGSVVDRPRPLRNKEYDALAGTVGWREVADGEWQFSNNDNAYLPMAGIASALASKQQDRDFVYFYYVASVRVEETDDERLLTSMAWFFNSVPEVQRRWREGLLVGPGKPESSGAHQ